MVYVLLADGFEEIEALSVVDILRRAEVPVKLLSAMEEKTVTGSHGIVVTADGLVGEGDLCDLLFLPGGMPGVTNLEKNKEVISLIQKQAASDGYIAAICAAPKILGQLGLLNGKKAACYPGFETYLKGAVLSMDKVVSDGKIITSRGAGTAMELGFYLAEVLKDKKTADTLKQSMIYE